MSALAAPYAAMVVDARSGEVLHSENADTPLHPASLTKMMTLYLAFEAVEHGELTMDTVVTISRNAAAEPPSKLGLRSGQKIKLRYLVRAAAVKSANDAATAIGEAISGSEAAFARRMNRTAKAMGMSRTTFKNANGLTETGHMSTARDMTLLGRHMIYDYPQYYNLFSRITTHAGMHEVYNTNRRFLGAYKGADGIKTGYTRAAGFNLVASAERGSERVVTTVFGGRSTASRNAKVAELMDLGFKRAKTRVALRAPGKPPYLGNRGLGNVEVARSADPSPDGARGKTIRVVSAAVTRSLRPQSRPGASSAEIAPLVASVESDIETVLASVQIAEESAVSEVEIAEAVPEAVAGDASDVAPNASIKPVRRPQGILMAAASAAPAEAQAVPVSAPVQETQEVVTRLSTSGGRHWGINVGRYPSRYAAEKVLLKTALMETSTLDGSLRKVIDRSSGFDANFMGLSRETADLACRRLQARQVTCFMIGPS
ncbi:D-alanyl-D-alanine carboxypeptidase family protein [Salipiger bermudensis]|uniref:D-alanyl-D-alanine carboxypeptidase family protein n=2 Tax=Roseobacteraceae TaxID=2854170 RepID=Q0FKY4_SALBH|nr:D-alanyl-D-alanine carboxypeptidase family protein [Salipiger bermudensis]EAU44876.1 D-alanyl-D-alanine carboxypeptidase family protein [Salipiger bermudensis HTCC2601]